MGCYFSINASMLESERHMTMVTSIPLDRVLTETDGPFTKTGDRAFRPSDVAVVVEALGRLHGMPESAFAATVRSNLRCLLRPQEGGI